MRYSTVMLMHGMTLDINTPVCIHMHTWKKVMTTLIFKGGDIYMWRYIIITLALLFSILVRWYQEPAYVQHNDCTILDLVSQDELKAIEKAYNKVGPLYSYTIDPDGTLRVDRGDGKPLRVRY
jgi:hypothetical protein